jgi:hypothetical protein
MKPDTARFIASTVTVAMVIAFVVLVATGASFAVCLVPTGIGILAGFIASTQPT